mgnify:FL=1
MAVRRSKFHRILSGYVLPGEGGLKTHVAAGCYYDSPSRFRHTNLQGPYRDHAARTAHWMYVYPDDRLRTSEAIFECVDASATFRAYAGVEHRVTGQMIDDIAAFHSRRKHGSFGPQFRRDIRLSGRSVSVDETLTVRASHENFRANQATTTATVSVDGDPRATREVEVAPGEATTIEADPSFDAAGEYTISLDETTAESVAVTPVDTGATPAADMEPTNAEGSEQSRTTATEQPWFGLVHTLSAVAGIGYLIGCRIPLRADYALTLHCPRRYTSDTTITTRSRGDSAPCRFRCCSYCRLSSRDGFRYPVVSNIVTSV